MKRTFRFIGNLLFILILLSVLFSYAMFQGGFVSWFLFYSFLPILLYHLALLFYPLKKWKVTRVLSDRFIHAGGSTHVALRIERTFPFPIYYAVFEEILPETLNKEDRGHLNYMFLNAPEKLLLKRSVKEVIAIGFRKTVEIPYSLERLPRGEHQFQSVRILISDVFGFVKKEYTFPLDDRLIVEPHERSIKLSDGTVSFESGPTMAETFRLESTNVATGVREYAPGDRFSWIHWKQTARNQMVMTKEFEQERSDSVLLVLDASSSGNKNPLAFEAGVELAASLFSALEKAAIDLELVVIGEEIRSFSLKERSHMKESIRYYLAKIQPGGKEPFSKMMQQMMQSRKKMERIIVITNSFDEQFGVLMQKLKLRTLQCVILYAQGSAFISEKDKKLISHLKKDGTAIHVMTEKVLATTPLEVNIR